MLKLTPEQEKRFWSKVSKAQEQQGCWIWTASTNQKQYGHFCVNGKLRGAHRISYGIHKGIIPENLIVCHSCDTPRCVNPEHLWLGTNADNSDDKIRKNRQVNVSGSAHGFHFHPEKFTNLNENIVREIRARYALGKVILKTLSEEYGVSESCIWLMVNRRTWRHIE